jgi:DNA-binding transcriptional LysR family regulator
MVSTRAGPPREPDDDYVYVDWGPEFYAQHLLAFPSFGGCALSVNVGWLGLNQIRASGGSGYFPLRMVREDERAGRLHRVPGVPEFRLPAYLCFPSKAASPPLDLALETLRRVAADAA